VSSWAAKSSQSLAGSSVKSYSVASADGYLA
jgi:hypothetical protein